MLLLKIFFGIALFIVFYSYLGYGLLLWIYIIIKDLFKISILPELGSEFEPHVALIIAAYNEELIINEKIKNCQQIDYPVEKLQIIIVADGSDDNTVNIISKYSYIHLLYKPERKGKVEAINRAMLYVKAPFVVFCDANTSLNRSCIREIIQHYQNDKVGAVAGEKKIITSSKNVDAAGAGEGLYWKYESFLKKLDSRFYTVVGAAGELFSIRTKLFEPIPSNILLDDFIISMNICLKGYRVIYEPRAIASETASFSMKEEQKRKIRISAGGFQSILLLKDVLNIFKHGRLSFQYISHRVLRWIVCPFLLPAILISNFILQYKAPSNLYLMLLLLQITFYFAAAIGWIFASKNIKIKAVYIPYYFVFINLSLYIGLMRYYRNKQSVLWDKAKRSN